MQTGRQRDPVALQEDVQKLLKRWGVTVDDQRVKSRMMQLLRNRYGGHVYGLWSVNSVREASQACRPAATTSLIGPLLSLRCLCGSLDRSHDPLCKALVDEHSKKKEGAPRVFINRTYDNVSAFFGWRAGMD